MLWKACLVSSLISSIAFFRASLACKDHSVCKTVLNNLQHNIYISFILAWLYFTSRLAFFAARTCSLTYSWDIKPKELRQLFNRHELAGHWVIYTAPLTLNSSFCSADKASSAISLSTNSWNTCTKINTTNLNTLLSWDKWRSDFKFHRYRKAKGTHLKFVKLPVKLTYNLHKQNIKPWLSKKKTTHFV